MISDEENTGQLCFLLVLLVMRAHDILRAPFYVSGASFSAHPKALTLMPKTREGENGWRAKRAKEKRTVRSGQKEKGEETLGSSEKYRNFCAGPYLQTCLLS